MFAGNFAPSGWMMCEGQLLPISENENLFTLIGTTYGGDGQSTFALPDLRGRVPIHQGQGLGSNYTVGTNGGTETVILSITQLPSHNHRAYGTSNDADRRSPKNALLAKSSEALYASTGATVLMNASPADGAGNNQPHTNLQPYLCLNFIIALSGVFPPRN